MIKGSKKLALMAFLMFSNSSIYAKCPDLTGFFGCQRGDTLEITQKTDDKGITIYKLFSSRYLDDTIILTSDGAKHDFYRHSFSASCDKNQLHVNIRKKIDNTAFQVTYEKVDDSLIIHVIEEGQSPQKQECF